MRSVHKALIHGRCPLNRAWDYYEVQITPVTFLDCHEVDQRLDKVRGREATQESLTHMLVELFPASLITVIGRHGQNVELETSVSTLEPADSGA